MRLAGQVSIVIKARLASRRAACGLPEGSIFLSARVCIDRKSRRNAAVPPTLFPLFVIYLSAGEPQEQVSVLARGSLHVEPLLDDL